MIKLLFSWVQSANLRSYKSCQTMSAKWKKFSYTPPIFSPSKYLTKKKYKLLSTKVWYKWLLYLLFTHWVVMTVTWIFFVCKVKIFRSLNVHLNSWCDVFRTCVFHTYVIHNWLWLNNFEKAEADHATGALRRILRGPFGHSFVLIQNVTWSQSDGWISLLFSRTS